jgi:hypothetical protein
MRRFSCPFARASSATQFECAGADDETYVTRHATVPLAHKKVVELVAERAEESVRLRYTPTGDDDDDAHAPVRDRTFHQDTDPADRTVAGLITTVAPGFGSAHQLLMEQVLRGGSLIGVLVQPCQEFAEAASLLSSWSFGMRTGQRIRTREKSKLANAV